MNLVLCRGAVLLAATTLLAARGTDTDPTPAPPGETSVETVVETSVETTVETSTAVAEPEPSTADCEPGAFAAGEFDDPAVLFCDGTWAFAGQNRTDWRMVFQATHGNWVAYQPHGETQSGMIQPCYDEQTLRTDGAPDGLVAQVPLCGG
ncbi:hypothetical protein [Corynebacterium sp.]|uniref:hypothetical protein n=1 Tax=Corynebacterium sp. TaxID=1720 RepID=UPI0026E027ED|nr:hypothetical protein [Corynebacterium sp.]MDO5512068.1 hypothetical protein [Corynebacterium sp.]